MNTPTTTERAITPEQRLRNLAQLVTDYTEVRRFSARRRPSDTPDALYPAARQLARLVLELLDGQAATDDRTAEVSSCR